ncbi:MAG: hypothetical protein WC809_00305 [Sinimarinibacterium sp.]|jgi:small multidrug resistance family-3 protein
MLAKTFALFTPAALAEIVDFLLPYLRLRKHGPTWLRMPATPSLASFARLLSPHPTAGGSDHAAWGGV